MRRLLTIIVTVWCLAACGGGGGGGDAGDGTAGAARIDLTAISLRGTLDADATVAASGLADLDPAPRAYRHDLVLGAGAIGSDPRPGDEPLQLTLPITAESAAGTSTRVVDIVVHPAR